MMTPCCNSDSEEKNASTLEHRVAELELKVNMLADLVEKLIKTVASIADVLDK